IPVKVESARLEHKNFTKVGGVSLVGRAVNVAMQAQALGLIDDVFISYDRWDADLSEFAGRRELTMSGQGNPKPTRTLEVVSAGHRQPAEGRARRAAATDVAAPDGPAPCAIQAAAEAVLRHGHVGDPIPPGRPPRPHRGAWPCRPDRCPDPAHPGRRQP